MKRENEVVTIVMDGAATVVADGAATIVVVDLETSGLNPEMHSILDIGAVALSWPELDVVGEFQRDVRLEAHSEWEREAELVHGITRNEADDGSRPWIGYALGIFLGWVDSVSWERKAMLAGMNPAFDRGFLQWKSRVCGGGPLFDRLFSHRLLDMHSLAVAEGWRWGLSAEQVMGLSTDAIYDLLGMVPEPRPHRAIVGARMEAAAIRCLLTGDDDGVPADFLPSTAVSAGEEVAG